MRRTDPNQWKELRNHPRPGAPRDPAAPNRGRYAQDIDLRAVTPIYKGGARPDAVDPAYPFRGAALRGQLRTWWRAVQTTTNTATLRDNEYQIFGGVFNDAEPRASRVSLGLSDMSSTPAKKSDLRELSGGSYDYALWVDRGQNAGGDLYHVDAKARLWIGASPIGHDGFTVDTGSLHKALKALVLMGGAGSRSRRGMGRLWSSELLGETVSDVHALQALVDALAPPMATRPWPSLAGARVAWKRNAALKTAGQAVDAALKDFKDLRGMRATGGHNFDGAHRLRQAQRDWELVRGNRPPKGAFTAALGMPLMYRSSNGHLRGVTKLEPQRGDRLPSPVHIRPVPTPGGWAAVIIALQPWFTGTITASNKQMGRHDGDLDPRAVDILLHGFASKDWDIGTPGGAT